MKKIKIFTTAHKDTPEFRDEITIVLYNAVTDDQVIAFAKNYYVNVISATRVVAIINDDVVYDSDKD